MEMKSTADTNCAQGFRMTVGSPATDSLNGTKKGLAYTCLETILTRGYETPDFPTKPCAAGIMGMYTPLCLPFPPIPSQKISLTVTLLCVYSDPPLPLLLGRREPRLPRPPIPHVQHHKRRFPPRRPLSSFPSHKDATTSLRDDVEHHRFCGYVAHRWHTTLRMVLLRQQRLWDACKQCPLLILPCSKWETCTNAI
jgi:hypothetical protein